MIGNKEFAAVTLDLEYESFIIHVISLSSTASLSSTWLNADIYLFYRPQIASLIATKASTNIPNKYNDFADVFFLVLESKLSEHTGINEHAIKLVNGQQPAYRPIYSLGLIELETLKAYIETNLANKFIKISKSPISTLIFFDWKLDSFFWLYVDYRGVNNFIIKNRYLLLLVEIC